MDGYPRTLAQAKSFKNGIDKVIYLEVSDKEALWRLSYRNGENGETREDDTLSAIRKRIELFHKFTEPVLEYYRKKEKLATFNGEEQIDKIHKEIMNKLAK